MPRLIAVPDPPARSPMLALDCSPISGDPDATCVCVAGDLDLDTAPQLEAALRDAMLSAGLVVLDLGDVASIDSSGVHAVDRASIRARRLGRRLVVLRGPAHVNRAFALAGISPDLGVSRADAVQPARPFAQRNTTRVIQAVANHA